MSEKRQLVLVTTTVDSMSDAEELAKLVLDHSLAACVQIEQPIVSLYRWKGKLERASEVRLTLKTTVSRWPDLKLKLGQAHRYEEPEIIMCEIKDSTDGYCNWVIEQTS